ncbi:MAG: hypothetical protein KHZ91_13295 [Firmicutes bacterium]|nr:hypothetical protein [Bacillota bacterium]
MGDILHCCHFPYPSYNYLQEEKIEEAEEKLLENEELMLDIYEKFGDYHARGCSNYGTDMDDACTEILEQFGKKHPDFLEAYETIDVIAYKKYQTDWVKRQNFSKEFMVKIQKEYMECKRKYYQNDTYTLQEYLDGNGFQGSCYVCIDEFREAEYLDAVYMNSLLSSEEYTQYLNDVSNYVWCDIVSVNGKIVAEEFPISGEMDAEFYQIDDFLEAVAKKYGVEPDEVKTYMMDGIDFDPKELPFGAESCGCYKNGELQFVDEIEYEIRRVEDMAERLPYGAIRDADTVLVDILEKNDFEFDGFAQDIFNIWRKSSDRKSVEQMFFEFTDCEFLDYLKKCPKIMQAVHMADAVGKWLKDKGIKDDLDFSALIDNLSNALEFWSQTDIKENRAEFFGQMIDQVETYLEDCGYEQDDIPSDDRNKTIADGEDLDALALIYGEDYDFLSTKFAEILKM